MQTNATPPKIEDEKMLISLLFLLFSWIQLSNAANASTVPPPTGNNPIGVNYGQLADNLPPPHEVVKILQSTHIGKIRIFNTDPVFLQAFANTGIDVVVGVSNDQVAGFSNSPSLSQQWVAKNIAPFAPATRIRLITVGNEVFTADDRELSMSILPAMKNIHSALVSFKLDDSIKVSTPHSFAILENSFPPSAGMFRRDSEMYVKPLVQFLSDTKAPFLINAYPYFAYRNNPKDIPLSYAMFLPNPGAIDPRTGLVYSNMYTAQVDAAYSALEKMGYFGIPVSVTETGWPSHGDDVEVGVSMQNAVTFNRNLIEYVSSNSGTPLRPRQPVDIYIFALFNENLKTGPTSERNYGLFKTDGAAVYDCGLMKEGNAAPLPGQTSIPVNYAPNHDQTKSSSTSSSSTSSSSTSSSSTSSSSTSSSSASSTGGSSWCVAKAEVDEAILLKALNYACGQGEADCSAIQSGGPCFFPDDVKSHASFAFNMYYQKHGRYSWNCNFGNTATITTTNPSYGSCYFKDEIQDGKKY